MRPFKGIICDDISQFESHMPSHAVASLSRIYPRRAAAIFQRDDLPDVSEFESDTAGLSTVHTARMRDLCGHRMARRQPDPHLNLNRMTIWPQK